MSICHATAGAVMIKMFEAPLKPVKPLMYNPCHLCKTTCSYYTRVFASHYKNVCHQNILVNVKWL